MSNIVLSDDLIKLYFTFSREGKIDLNRKATLSNLLTNIREFYTNKAQLYSCGITDEIITAIETSIPLCNIDNTTQNIEELVQKSKLKLQLVDKRLNELEANEYSIKEKRFHYARSFKPNIDRSFAKWHIKSLVQGATKVELVDPYFNADENQLQANLALLNDLICDKTIQLNIKIKDQENTSELKNTLSEQGYEKTNCSADKNLHDRYIKVNNLKIHLSAGFYAITQQSKEFTYMVEILQEQPINTRI